MKEKKPSFTDASAAQDKGKKKSGRKKYIIPLVTALAVASTTEEVMAKCKCEPVDDSHSTYF